MKRKRTVVLETPQLRDLLGPSPVISEDDSDPILLRSDKYCQLGCDLRRLDALRQTLESFLALAECSVLFVAEVSITYMDTASADALIQWASSIGQGSPWSSANSLPWLTQYSRVLPPGADSSQWS